MEIGAINQSMQMTGFGSRVSLKTTDPLHFSENGEVTGAANDDVAKSFSDMLNEMVGKTNDLQVESDGLTKKMIYDPGSVNIHTVMIAQQKAEVALTFTKAVRDEAIRSYRELMNLR
jgi:flagellar hook-basal body complex protein FliE